MGILINLLPDLRQAKLREQRRRQTAIGVSVLVWAVCGVTVLLMFLYSAGIKVRIAGLNDNIAKNKVALNSVDGLTDALTAAQHLNSLSSLYANRVLFSQFFSAYSASDPVDTTLSSLTVDETNNLTVSGASKSFASLAKLQRALEQSNVTIGDGASTKNTAYFSSVKVQSAVNTAGKGVVFTLNATVSSEVLHAK